MVGDLVQSIGGEHIEARVLIFGEMDPHSYELVKGDDEKILSSDIVFYNGLGLEHGASLSYQLSVHPNSVPLGKALSSNSLLYVDGQIDPHVWMDISLWKQTVPTIVATLSHVDPQHAKLYAARGKELTKEMESVHQAVIHLISQVPSEKRYLVTSHDAFNYFARAYLGGSDRFAAPEGLAPDGQLSSSNIREIVDHLLEHRIEFVFPESNVSRDSLKKIVEVAAKKGLKVQFSSGPLYGDAMGPKGSGADTYLNMIKHNAQVLHDEWTGS